METLDRAERSLSGNRLSDKTPLFTIGSFDKQVTVLSQQTRALNLAWSLIETGKVPVRGDGKECKVAIVGAGFAGMTLAAGLISKGADCDLYMFEQRDSLLPLQQGSDTRWLHPHIYDWPAPGSEASAAMLPVLNWTAARSSDVVVQVLSEWNQIIQNKQGGQRKLRLFCNARHVQVAECAGQTDKARLEWVGEERTPEDGTILGSGELTSGSAETFDIIVLAVGFGVEKAKASYWRNETVGQPNLNEPRRTYLLSGQGDGAMVDLFRIRISQFRQDRILDELFANQHGLVGELKELRRSYESQKPDLFESFEKLASPKSHHEQAMRGVITDLKRRLRRDTDVVLKLRVRNIAELLRPVTSRMSFQNALLVYLLYRCGGFTPTTESDANLRQRFAVSKDSIIERHGVRPMEQLKAMLPVEITKEIEARRKEEPKEFAVQQDGSLWPGGYFGQFGRSSESEKVLDAERQHWRKEYLPGTMALVATTLCGSIKGALERLRPKAKHFRVTFHRSISIHNEALLQQSCDYIGRGLEKAEDTAARVLPAETATVGAAYRSGKIIRSTKDVEIEVLKKTMRELKLNESARGMLESVDFVLAIPVVQPAKYFYGPSRVAGVLYVDSRDQGFWLKDHEVAELSALFEAGLRAIEEANVRSLGRIRNFALEPLSTAKEDDGDTLGDLDALEIVTGAKPATTTGAFVLNYDYTDLVPVVAEKPTKKDNLEERTDAREATNSL
ncbi:hypothetical protein [Tateyamaria sp.]|uniref:hypothetical protein n=1 Tax=Tateyamaria sp. TaxID=1929288 RepID=UPI00329ADA3D